MSIHFSEKVTKQIEKSRRRNYSIAIETGVGESYSSLLISSQKDIAEDFENDFEYDIGSSSFKS